MEYFLYFMHKIRIVKVKQKTGNFRLKFVQFTWNRVTIEVDIGKEAIGYEIVEM